MPIALSSQMAANLNSLLSVNDNISITQNRVSTGKAISSASDNIAVYFKAQSYADKADFLDTTNQGIAQAIKNLDMVDSTLSNMRDSIKGARQILSDARAKAITAGQAVTMPAGTQAYGETTVNKTGGTRTLLGAIVDPKDRTLNPSTALANINDGAYFQDGDIFRVDFNDPATGTRTVYLKAVAADGADPVQSGKKGDSATTAIEFNDLASLATGLNQALGIGNAQFTAVRTPGVTPTYKLSMTLGKPTQSITFGQVTDAKFGSPPTSGEAFDFTKLLKNASASKAAGSNLTIGNSLDETNAPNAASYTYSSATPASTDTTAIDGRKQAADFFRQTIYSLDASVRDAFLPGYANILNGETMKVSLNDTDTTTQSVRIPSKIDVSAAADTTNSFGAKFVNTGGVITTGYTDPTSASDKDFQSDQLLDAAIKKFDTMTTAIGQYQKSLAASKTAMSARLDYNKLVVKTLSDGAVSMTAADMATEAAKLAALQNQQNFAATNMANTKQAEASLIQLLR